LQQPAEPDTSPRQALASRREQSIDIETPIIGDRRKP